MKGGGNLCANCGEPQGDHHHSTGMWPVYGKFADGCVDYDALLGFGGGEFTDHAAS